MVGLYQSQAASDAKLFTVSGKYQQPQPRVCEQSGQLSDYGHRSQISARQYLQETRKLRVLICWATICSDGCQLAGNGHLAAVPLQRTVKGDAKAQCTCLNG